MIKATLHDSSRLRKPEDLKRSHFIPAEQQRDESQEFHAYALTHQSRKVQQWLYATLKCHLRTFKGSSGVPCDSDEDK